LHFVTFAASFVADVGNAGTRILVFHRCFGLLLRGSAAGEQRICRNEDQETRTGSRKKLRGCVKAGVSAQTHRESLQHMRRMKRTLLSRVGRELPRDEAKLQ
jgi:hypothetical protein